MTPEQTLDWLAEQHKSQCNEDRPVQEWIRSMKSMLPAPVQEPVAYWIPKAEQFCIADPSGRPFAKAWEPLYTTPPAQPAPVQEPVAQYSDIVSDGGLDPRNKFDTTPPAAQRQWVGLTDDEVRKINQEVWGYVSADHTRMRGYAHAIEAKLKEKNT